MPTSLQMSRPAGGSTADFLLKCRTLAAAAIVAAVLAKRHNALAIIDAPAQNEKMGLKIESVTILLGGKGREKGCRLSCEL